MSEDEQQFSSTGQGSFNKPDLPPSPAPKKTFETGAQRQDSSGKGRFDLIPFYPLLRLARHYEAGAKKYAPWNWTKGMPLSRMMDSAMRHLGNFVDGDRTEDHLAAALWNICGYIWAEREIRQGRLPETLRDVPWKDSEPFERQVQP